MRIKQSACILQSILFISVLLVFDACSIQGSAKRVKLHEYLMSYKPMNILFGLGLVSTIGHSAHPGTPNIFENYNCHRVDNRILDVKAEDKLQNISKYLYNLYKESNYHSVLSANPYIEPKVSDSPGAYKYLLSEKIEKFLNNKLQNLLVIFGSSKSGKSIVSHHLYNEFWQEYKDPKDYLPIYIDLENEKYVHSEYLILQNLEKQGLSKSDRCFLNEKGNLIVLIDGYDNIVHDYNPYEDNMMYHTQSKMIVFANSNAYTNDQKIIFSSRIDAQKPITMHLNDFSTTDAIEYLNLVQEKNVDSESVCPSIDDRIIISKKVLKIWSKVGYSKGKFYPDELKEILNKYLNQSYNPHKYTKSVLDQWYQYKILKLDKYGVLYNDHDLNVTQVKRNFARNAQRLALNMYIEETKKIKRIIYGNSKNKIWEDFFLEDTNLQRIQSYSYPIRYTSKYEYKFINSRMVNFLISELLMSEINEFVKNQRNVLYLDKKLYDESIIKMLILYINYGSFVFEDIRKGIVLITKVSDKSSIAFNNTHNFVKKYLSLSPDEYIYEELSEVENYKSGVVPLFLNIEKLNMARVDDFVMYLQQNNKSEIILNLVKFHTSDKDNDIINGNVNKITKTFVLKDEYALNYISSRWASFCQIRLKEKLIEKFISNLITSERKYFILDKILDNTIEHSELCITNTKLVLKKYNKNLFTLTYELKNNFLTISNEEKYSTEDINLFKKLLNKMQKLPKNENNASYYECIAMYFSSDASYYGYFGMYFTFITLVISICYGI